MKVMDDCSVMSIETQQRYTEAGVMARGFDAAVMNLSKHVKALDQKNADFQAWVKDVQKEEELAGTDWESSIRRLRGLPTTHEIIKYITGRDLRRTSRKPTLEDLISIEDVETAGKLVKTTSTQLSKNSTELGTKVDNILKKADELFDKLEASAKSAVGHATEPIQLMQDIEAIAKKVSNDYESIVSYENTPKNISQASKSALNHTKTFLPNLIKRSAEMDSLLRKATIQRNSVAADSLDLMRDIADLTALVSEANAKFSEMEQDRNAEDAFHILSAANALPVTYASFLAEAIRRQEWNDKVKSDSSTLANEMATFQDEEAKRRRKWQKTNGTTLWGEKAERKVIGLEVNLLGGEGDWPQVTREDLNQLLESLQASAVQTDIVSDVAKIISDLNNPTKQQSKRAKAFKNGSMHEAALGRSTLLVRGDNEVIRTLQEEKQRTESKLRTAESRVRRLEDLLHRQSQVSRTSTGNIFQLPSTSSPDHQIANPLASPRLNDDFSRRSSVSSRRFSANQGADEKVLQQKLLSLEAELITERERSSGLEKEVFARKHMASQLQAKVDEAQLNKTDLMENFNTQQRDFVEERKSLEGEIKRLKAKLEELEDEMDRYLGSREHEKASVDERVRSLQDERDKMQAEHKAELEGLHKDHETSLQTLQDQRVADVENAQKKRTEEVQKAQGQIDFLRNDAKLQREANDSLFQQLQSAKVQNKQLLERAAKAETYVAEQLQILKDVHAYVAPEQAIPQDSTSVAETVLGLVKDTVAQLEFNKNDASIARNNRHNAESTLVQQKSEIEHLKSKITQVESESSQIRGQLSEQQAKFVALEAELIDERNQLSSLRSKISDGETGSVALRTRLEEEERKVTSMSENLAVRQSRIGGLEEELRAVQERLQTTSAKHEELSSRLDSRTLRARDLTQRVYAQNDRLCRLLERLSYSITREGHSMVIQRLPRPERSTTNDSSDPGTSLRRSVLGVPTRKSMLDSGDLDLINWMQNDDEDVESEKYEAYLKTAGNFDVEAFCEVITKRIKDIEYTAKKYSKDARAYREKSHAAQKEAHEKIAFKSFKEGDLALFLPTRNQATGAWAAFNLGAPHYFLKEEESHKLRTRDWLVARIHKIEDRVVDLSKSMTGMHLNASDGRSFASNGGDSFEDDNPFDLSDGLRWYLIDAAEEKPGAPSTPGLGKSTVAATNVDATGSIRRSKKSSSGVEGINKTLSKSLDSRRGSNNSKKSVPLATTPTLIRTGSGATDTAASLKGAPTTQTTEDGPKAGIIRSNSKLDITGQANGDKSLRSEVRNDSYNPLDDLMGP